MLRAVLPCLLVLGRRPETPKASLWLCKHPARNAASWGSYSSATHCPKSKEFKSPSVTNGNKAANPSNKQSGATVRPLCDKGKGKGKGAGLCSGGGDARCKGDGGGKRSDNLCPPRPDPQKSSLKRALFWGSLGANILLGGLYFLGYLDPLLDMLGLGGPFPGAGSLRKRRARHRHPHVSSDLPDSVGYLVVGGGSAGIAAARSIRANDKNAQVLIIGGENAFPYQRSALSKNLWQSRAGACFVAADGSLRSIFYEPDDFFIDCEAMAEGAKGVALARGWEVERLKLSEHEAVLSDGTRIHYDKCVLATGTSPYQLRVFERANDDLKQKVLYMHDVCDYETLRSAVRGGARDIVVVGSCPEACELAASLARHGRDVNIPGLRVTLVFPDEAPNAKVLPVYLGKYVARCLEQEGVRCLPKSKINSAKLRDGQHAELRLNTGEHLSACRVVVVAATAPNTDIGGRSGLPLDGKNGGFVADGDLFAKDDVWAAGDCVSFCSLLHGRTRWEGVDHALATGKLAGRNMVAAAKGNTKRECYDYLPVRWASLCPGAAYEAVGEVDAALTTVGVFSPALEEEERRVGQTPAHATCDRNAPDARDSAAAPADYARGVVFYLRDNTVVGILTWNLPRRITIARNITQNQIHYDELDEAVRQLCIHK